MNSDLSRRRMMQAVGATAMAPSVMAAAQRPWPIVEGPDTPKICLPGALGRGRLPPGEATRRQLCAWEEEGRLPGRKRTSGPR